VSVVSIRHDEFRRDDRFSSLSPIILSSQLKFETPEKLKEKKTPRPQPISFHIHHQVDIILHVDDVHTRAILNKKL
jgi:hypothetical protein